ncbi:hypothetical protein HMPREF0183_0819 [Brevibacterium mcbrellneri ATCC 49030]|uniref:Uncharacterized protein n=1 Tax=Brevibacterium mcbrellneri ATCC 49030 TaxID=585530 RepID=D4YLK9_9MICO|nr:hypothetical protein HMPREF0183_0819 [Brevibacterium mcbrellneri ATCC 49030]
MLNVGPGLTFGELEVGDNSQSHLHTSAGGDRVIWIQSSSILRVDCIQKTPKQ